MVGKVDAVMNVQRPISYLMQGQASFCSNTLPPLLLFFLTSLPSFENERLYLHKRSSSCEHQLCLLLLFLPRFLRPASPDTEPHEIYTAFQFNVNEGNVSLGLHGMMVEIP